VRYGCRAVTPHPQVVAETLLALRSRHSVPIGWWASPRSGALREEVLGSEGENPTLADFFSKKIFQNLFGCTSGGFTATVRDRQKPVDVVRKRDIHNTLCGVPIDAQHSQGPRRGDGNVPNGPWGGTEGGNII
jgi:hypothetical protein